MSDKRDALGPVKGNWMVAAAKCRGHYRTREKDGLSAAKRGDLKAVKAYEKAAGAWVRVMYACYMLHCGEGWAFVRTWCQLQDVDEDWLHQYKDRG